MEAIEHYKKKLQRHIDEPDVVIYCLKKLDNAAVTIELLTDSDVGRVVNRLKKKNDTSQEVIKASKALVEKWKELVKNAEEQAEVAQVSTGCSNKFFDEISEFHAIELIEMCLIRKIPQIDGRSALFS